MTRPWVLVRVDSGQDMGTGHWMRCLSLADALTDQGYDIVFLCRQSLPALEDLTRNSGHALVRLEGAEQRADGLYRHSAWLNVTETADGAESFAVLQYLAERRGRAPSWVVVDHYALAAPWEARMQILAPVVAIDDLNDRPHQATVLIDQTAGKTVDDYRGLLAPHTIALVGADYVMIRPAFIEQRAASLLRRRQLPPEPWKVLLTLGGVDSNNITQSVLQALLPLKDRLSVQVITGFANPNIQALQHWRDRHWADLCLEAATDRMVDVMEAADFCIGAAGTTSWERCVMGLPTVLLLLAENQTDVARNLSSVGAVINFGAMTVERQSEMTSTVAALLDNPSELLELSTAAAQLCDARGLERIVSVLMET